MIAAVTDRSKWSEGELVKSEMIRMWCCMYYSFRSSCNAMQWQRSAERIHVHDQLRDKIAGPPPAMRPEAVRCVCAVCTLASVCMCSNAIKST